MVISLFLWLQILEMPRFCIESAFIPFILFLSSFLPFFHSFLSPEGPVGKVIGVEHVEALVDWSKANVARQGNPILNTAVVLRGGDGRRGL